MKLLHCQGCGDIVRIYTYWRLCHCKRSAARYIDDIRVRLMGPSRAIGIDTGGMKRGRAGTWHESENVER